MFPQISDIINYFFGTHINLPIQSYGFFMALSFLMGAYFIKLELKRKENEGLLKVITKKILKGAPASIQELIFAGIFGLLLGFKLIGIIFEYNVFADNPQAYIFSLKGSIFGAITFSIISVAWRYYSKKISALDEPVWIEIELHPHQLTGNILIIAALSGLLGAKIFHNLENFQTMIDDPIGSIFSFMGLTFYGGLIVGSLTTVWYSKRNNIPVLDLIDASAPALMLSYGIGRLGCLLSGDGCWGIANLKPKPDWLSFLPDWTWAFKFPHNVIGEGIPIDKCTGKYCNILEYPVYPTSFYDFVLCIIFFMLLWFIRRKINIRGILFSIMLIIFGVQRFFMELIRVNNKFKLFGIEYTQAELISVIIILIGVICLGLFIKKEKKT